jgi:hypothetical protein
VRAAAALAFPGIGSLNPKARSTNSRLRAVWGSPGASLTTGGTGKIPRLRYGHALEALLSRGVVLPTAQTFKIFDSLQDELRQSHSGNHELGLLVRALCVLPFVDRALQWHPENAGGRDGTKLRERRAYQLRDLATALGQSRSDDAVILLHELASDQINAQSLGESWINALALLDNKEAKESSTQFCGS